MLRAEALTPEEQLPDFYSPSSWKWEVAAVRGHGVVSRSTALDKELPNGHNLQGK